MDKNQLTQRLHAYKIRLVKTEAMRKFRLGKIFRWKLIRTRYATKGIKTGILGGWSKSYRQSCFHLAKRASRLKVEITAMKAMLKDA